MEQFLCSLLLEDANENTQKNTILNLLFKERIGERDRKITAMSVGKLIENLHDENGYGKFIVLGMIEHFNSLDDKDQMKIID